jgi:glycosyltransferase involved in cell wall biosynthesis
MKVLHIITSLSAGGAEVMMKRIIMAMRSPECEATVVGLSGWGVIGEELRDEGMPVLALGGRNGMLYPRQVADLIKAFYRVQPDVVHCWMYHANVAGHALVRIKPKNARPALIVSIRASLHMEREHNSRLRLVPRLDAVLSRYADAIVFNSHRAVRQHAEIGYAVERSTVIPNCFDTEELKPMREEGEQLRREWGCGREPLVGLVARFTKEKDHRNFLFAARMVVERFPGTKFALVGKQCEKSNVVLTRWIAECGLGDAVLLLGERRDVGVVNSAIDVAVSSSLSEGFPNSIGEAMSCGTPCVVTNVGDSGLLVGETGVVVPAADPTSLANAIIKVIGLPHEKRRELGGRARQRVISEFALKTIIRRFARLYEDCVLRKERERGMPQQRGRE